jgi:hypothetical protein
MAAHPRRGDGPGEGGAGQCKTSIKGCNKLLLCITVKLVHKIMRVFYSHCFAF